MILPPLIFFLHPLQFFSAPAQINPAHATVSRAGHFLEGAGVKMAGSPPFFHALYELEVAPKKNDVWLIFAAIFIVLMIIYYIKILY